LQAGGGGFLIYGAGGNEMKEAGKREETVENGVEEAL